MPASSAASRMVAPVGTSMVRSAWAMRTLKLILAAANLFAPQTISVYHSGDGPSTRHALRPKALDRGLLPSLLGYALRRAQSAVFADFAATFAKAGEALTPGEFGLLVLVDRNAGLSQMALARALGIDRSTLVPILDRLQARGLLVRRPLADRRPHARAGADAGRRDGAGPVRQAGAHPRAADRLGPFGRRNAHAHRAAGEGARVGAFAIVRAP